MAVDFSRQGWEAAVLVSCLRRVFKLLSPFACVQIFGCVQVCVEACVTLALECINTQL